MPFDVKPLIDSMPQRTPCASRHPPHVLIRAEGVDPRLAVRTCVYSRYAACRSQFLQSFLGSPDSLDNARLIWTLPLTATAGIRRATLLNEEAERVSRLVQ